MLKIKLFGKAKELAVGGSISLQLEQAVSVNQLKDLLLENLSGELTPEQAKVLLADCAFGNSEKILTGHDLISEDQELVILPPVCGG